MIRCILFILLLIGFSRFVGAQDEVSGVNHNVKLNLEVPVQYGVGYEVGFAERWSGVLQVGFLTEPNSTLVLNVLESFGVEKSVVLMIEDAFESGLVLEQGVNFGIKRNYIGVFAQQYFLRGSNTPKELVEDAMDEDLSQYPRFQRRLSRNTNTIELRSNLYQLGLLYGYRLPLRRDLELNFEFSISANLGSESSIKSEERDYKELSKKVDVYLGDIYSTYGYVPSLAIALIKKLP
jgi:hypothetical protein